ncbi:MAG: DNA cytosine methyltransferase [Acidobacteriota bacterium]|nr:DNA cytosine methyltransferase [Acidobacteriota bacterium]
MDAPNSKNNGRRSTIPLIDLFAGAGGLTSGFTERFGHNFAPVWANDFNEHAVATYNANFGGHCVGGDIVDVLEDPGTVIPPAEVVIGGPPCQGFSLLNKGKTNDPRKQLWRPYLDVVERSGARVFLMENVPQLLKSGEFEEIRREAERLGFKLAAGILRAADYGVPQRRYRAFILGCTFAGPNRVFPPKRTHYMPDAGVKSIFKVGGEFVPAAEAWRTVRDAISDLPPPVGTEIRDEEAPLDLHFGRTPTELSRRRYEAIPEEGMNRFDLQARAPELTPECWIRKKTGGTDLFGRLWWDRPAFTIRTEFFKPEKGRYLHPEQHRPITHREAARLQSFPDDFKFVGSKIEIAKQIGNAVPPLLAAAVAGCVSELLSMKGK